MGLEEHGTPETSAIWKSLKKVLSDLVFQVKKCGAGAQFKVVLRTGEALLFTAFPGIPRTM